MLTMNDKYGDITVESIPGAQLSNVRNLYFGCFVL